MITHLWRFCYCIYFYPRATPEVSDGAPLALGFIFHFGFNFGLCLFRFHWATLMLMITRLWRFCSYVFSSPRATPEVSDGAPLALGFIFHFGFNFGLCLFRFPWATLMLMISRLWRFCSCMYLYPRATPEVSDVAPLALGFHFHFHFYFGLCLFRFPRATLMLMITRLWRLVFIFILVCVNWYSVHEEIICYKNR